MEESDVQESGGATVSPSSLDRAPGCGHTHLRKRYAQMRIHVELTAVMISRAEGILEVQLTAEGSKPHGEYYMLVRRPGTGLART
jgi:hypothetical protein